MIVDGMCNMETLSLKCPLCCDETFSSHDSLKYHILSLTENLLCSACDKRFYNLYDLTDHLGNKCKIKNLENLSSNIENESEPQASENITSELLQPKVETTVNDGETYFCHMCNINILSVEEHLEHYHQGEDIIMVCILSALLPIKCFIIYWFLMV